MRPLVFVLFVLAVTLVEGYVPLRKVALGKPESNQKDGIHFMCTPCKKLMSALQKALPTLDGLTKEGLDLAIKTECAKLTLDIPFLDQLCDKFGEKEVNILYNLIMKEGGKIDPEKDCRAIRFC